MNRHAFRGHSDRDRANLSLQVNIKDRQRADALIRVDIDRWACDQGITLIRIGILLIIRIGIDCPVGDVHQWPQRVWMGCDAAWEWIGAQIRDAHVNERLVGQGIDDGQAGAAFIGDKHPFASRTDRHAQRRYADRDDSGHLAFSQINH